MNGHPREARAYYPTVFRRSWKADTDGWVDVSCEQAASDGDLARLQVAHAAGCPMSKEVCKVAARSGRLDCLRFAHEHGAEWDEDVCAEAAKYDYFECLRYARENGCPWDKRVCDGAIRADPSMRLSLSGPPPGNLAMLKYARERGCPWSGRTKSMRLTHPEHAEMLLWIAQQADDDAVIAAAEAAALAAERKIRECHFWGKM